MRRLLSYIAISVFFFSTTGLSQLFKLPVLLAHYQEHRERDKRINMLDFLSMHYWGHDINDNDQDRDMQLPFKGIEQYSTAQIVLMPNQAINISRPPVIASMDQPIYIDADHSDPTLNSLFRPPRG